MEVLPGEVWGLQDEVVTNKGQRAEQVVPLEKDRSGMIPPIITPSEEVVQVVEHERELGAVLSKAHGQLSHPRVSLVPTLQRLPEDFLGQDL